MEEPEVLDHNQLLINLKKSIELWFLLRRDERQHNQNCQHNEHQIDDSIISTLQIQSAIKSILIDGLKSENINNSYQQLANDLNWLHASSTQLQQQQITNIKIQDESTTITENTTNNNNDFLSLWIYDSVRLVNLCSSLQLLVTDKELLEHYYTIYAFVRNEKYSTALFICISAFELKQSSLLSQIDESLLSHQHLCHQQQQQHLQVPETTTIRTYHHHKRSSSHPNFSISPKTTTNFMTTTTTATATTTTMIQEQNTSISNQKCLNKMYESLNLYQSNNYDYNFMKRKWKSLPQIHIILNKCNDYRPRSKTISQPIAIPNQKIQTQSSQLHAVHKFHKNNTMDEKNPPDFVYQQCSNGASASNNSSNDSKYNYNNNSSSNNTPTTSKMSNFHHNSAVKCIQCNDIKIHLDVNFENLNNSTNLTPQNPNNIDKNIPTPKSTASASASKGLSPINFLSCISSNIFSPLSKTSESTIWSTPTTNPNNHTSANAIGGFSSSLHNDVFGSFVTRDGEKLTKSNPKDFFDNITQNMSTRMNSSRNNNQTLTTLLQSHLFSHNNSDLERENAHFKISETIISVIEHIKWTKTAKEKENTEEQQNQIQIDNENYNSTKHKNTKITCNLESTEAVETATSYLDNSKDNDDTICYAESASEGDGEEIVQNLNDTNDHVAYAEWGANSLNTLSAEGVALSLISKFSDRQLPKVSELKWLVSEEDTPQKLLPMPDLYASENPDDHVIRSLTRGTRDWAPPRQQIIFTEYTQTNRKQMMLRQNYRCAGCGMRVAPMYMNRFRFCSYLGKYHCTGCHRNHISTIPAKVLNRWDFTFYPVSVFTYRLLEQIWAYPLFAVSDVAPNLYKRIKSLNIVKHRRHQIKFLKDFITTCRFANNELELFNEFPTYFIIESDLWSMVDFINIKNGKLIKSLDNLITICEKHVFDCVLCTARGFLCELCRQDNIIYPWQLKVNRCDKCGSCFHKNCCKKQLITAGNCVKCQRLIQRQQNLNTDILRSINNDNIQHKK